MIVGDATGTQLPFCQRPIPVAAWAASWRLPIVALIAQVRRPGRSRRSQPRASSHWLPRLLPISSCHSSSTTASSPANRAVAAGFASSRQSDSGVLIRISGGWRSCLLRMVLLVSPLRIATRNGQPMSRLGASIARARSPLRALRGVITSSRRPRAVLPFGVCACACWASISAIGPITAA